MSAADKYTQRKGNRRRADDKADESQIASVHFMSAAEKYAQRKENRRNVDDDVDEHPPMSAHFMSAAEKYAMRKANKRTAEKEEAQASRRHGEKVYGKSCTQCDERSYCSRIGAEKSVASILLI